MSQPAIARISRQRLCQFCLTAKLGILYGRNQLQRLASANRAGAFVWDGGDEAGFGDNTSQFQEAGQLQHGPALGTLMVKRLIHKGVAGA